jgi:hypothetical protein
MLSSKLYIVLTENHQRNCKNKYGRRTYDIKDNEQSGNVNWWYNELHSLGIKKISDGGKKKDNDDKNEYPTSQQLEELTDNIKQLLIHDYKACYDK